MKKRSLLLAASVMAGVALGVTPSARADDCTDGDMKYSAALGGTSTCVAGEFRYATTMPPTWHGNPCREGDTFTGFPNFIYNCIGGQYCVETPGVLGRRCGL